MAPATTATENTWRRRQRRQARSGEHRQRLRDRDERESVAGQWSLNDETCSEFGGGAAMMARQRHRWLDERQGVVDKVDDMASRLTAALHRDGMSGDRRNDDGLPATSSGIAWAAISIA
uniref:Uncharacterized protein n=1 Tax=Oryza barthii TaxID=65489 RepID=A0A0D3GD76_9ORYZ